MIFGLSDRLLCSWLTSFRFVLRTTPGSQYSQFLVRARRRHVCSATATILRSGTTLSVCPARILINELKKRRGQHIAETTTIITLNGPVVCLYRIHDDLYESPSIGTTFIWSIVLIPYLAQPSKKEEVKLMSYVTIVIRYMRYVFWVWVIYTSSNLSIIKISYYYTPMDTINMIIHFWHFS